MTRLKKGAFLVVIPYMAGDFVAVMSDTSCFEFIAKLLRVRLELSRNDIFITLIEFYPFGESQQEMEVAQSSQRCSHMIRKRLFGGGQFIVNMTKRFQRLKSHHNITKKYTENL